MIAGSRHWHFPPPPLHKDEISILGPAAYLRRPQTFEHSEVHVIEEHLHGGEVRYVTKVRVAQKPLLVGADETVNLFFSIIYP